MGNRLSRRRQVVNDNYTRPRGLDQIRDVDYRKVRKLILESRLAPCYPGDDECDDGGPLEECPICFLYYPTLNRSKCCRQGICTVCFLKVKNHDSTMPSSCPFCKTLNFAVEYKGAKSKEDRTREQIEEQKVAEAKIRMRQREVQGEEEKQHKKEVSFPDGKWGEKAKRKGNINLIVEEAFDESLEAERMATTSEVPHVVPPPISPIWECATCGGPASTRCSRCKSFKYCSGKCQIIHWNQGHREECRRPDDIDSSSTCVALDEASPMGDFGHGYLMQAETQFDVQLNPVDPSATSAEVSPTCSASLELSSRPERRRRATERRVSRKTTKEKVDVRHSVATISADGSLRSTPIILDNDNVPHKVMEKAKVGHNTIAHGVLPGQYITGNDYVPSSSSSSSLLPLPSSSPSPSPLSPSPISGGLAGAFAALARHRELIEESSYSECMSPSNMLPSSSRTLWRSYGQYITGNDYVSDATMLIEDHEVHHLRNIVEPGTCYKRSDNWDTEAAVLKPWYGRRNHADRFTNLRRRKVSLTSKNPHDTVTEGAKGGILMRLALETWH